MTQPLVEARLLLTSTEAAQRLCGPSDQHLLDAEETYGVTVTLNGLDLCVEGERSEEALRHLVQRQATALSTAPATVRTGKGAATPRTAGQTALQRALATHSLVAADGPAGTGKTRLAIDAGVHKLKTNEVQRLVLARPAVEAGERIGFLPGDMKDKVDPYMRPLYDALEYHYDPKTIAKLIEERIIEIAPVAFMRGRTLQKAAIIIDEAQNLTFAQTKMILTRLGENATMALVGDSDQVDLPKSTPSGFVDALQRLEGVEGAAVVRLTETDCVRSALVSRILRAYNG